MNASDRPNILLIITDDQRPDTIGALGNPYIHTPNLDRLANEGVAFDRTYCTTPICTPARAEVLTGCTSYANGVPWFGMPINPGLTLLPQALRDGGYHTIHVGKWHNDGHPRDKGYDAVRCVDHVYSDGRFSRFEEPDGRILEGHDTELFTDAALEELERAPEDNPWFCYLAYKAPHDPHDSPEPFSSMYDPAEVPLFLNYMPEHPLDNGDMNIRDEHIDLWPRTQEAMRRYRCRYYGIISHLDYHIGQLLGRLKIRGDLENTIIVFTSDQGLACGSHGLLGKENMYDHSVGAPLIYWGPGIPSGGRSSAMVHHVDLFPTLCELSGVERPSTAKHGHSLLPLMRGQVEKVRNEIFCNFYSPEYGGGPMRHTQRCIRTERWKLVYYPMIDTYQLFDLRYDANELVDLLKPWRKRYRLIEEAGKGVASRSWYARDWRPKYTQAQVDAVVTDLHQRLLGQMAYHEDPLLEEVEPCCSDK